MPFQPDTQHMLDVLANRRPARLPIYEHVISPKIMQQVLDVRFEDLEGGDRHDLDELPEIYRAYAGPKLDALVRQLPRGVKALGGVGNGVFEISEDMVGVRVAGPGSRARLGQLDPRLRPDRRLPRDD